MVCLGSIPIDLPPYKAAPLQAMGNGHVRGRFREPPAAYR
jgi:hypothetical protein